MHVQHPGIVLTELLDLASLTTFRQRTLVQGLVEGSHVFCCTEGSNRSIWSCRTGLFLRQDLERFAVHLGSEPRKGCFLLLVNGFHHLQSMAQALHGLIQVNDGGAVSLTFQAPFMLGCVDAHVSDVDV